MVIYEVDLQIERDVAQAFAHWLPGHVRAVLALEGFQGATWLEVDGEPQGAEAEDQSPARWIVRYEVRDQAALDTYLAEHATRMRADGLARFGKAFSATRRVLKERERF